jgi:CDP-glycerol glycerophosphotransferase
LKNFLKQTLLFLLQAFPQIRAWLRRMLQGWRAWRFQCIRKHISVNPKLFVFESYMGRSYSCNPKALYQEMLHDPKYRGYEFVWVFRQPLIEQLARFACDQTETSRMFSVSDVEELKHARIIRYASTEYHRVYAQAKCWITNSILPTYLSPSIKQFLLQTWHGTPFKRLGFDLADGVESGMFSIKEVRQRYRNEAERVDAFLSPSLFCTEKFISAFDLATINKADQVIETGYPRNDFLSTFTERDVAETKRRLAVPEDKKLLLYAPTFRDNQHRAGQGFSYELAIDFNKWRHRISNEYFVLFRSHYLVIPQLNLEPFQDFVLDVSEVNDVNDLYIVSDLLITDYSSVFFDYAMLNRPIIFYLYDRDDYAQNLRGFYLREKDLPGPVTTNEDELLKSLATVSEWQSNCALKLKDFRQRFCPWQDGYCARRALSALDLQISFRSPDSLGSAISSPLLAARRHLKC